MAAWRSEEDVFPAAMRETVLISPLSPCHKQRGTLKRNHSNAISADGTRAKLVTKL